MAPKCSVFIAVTLDGYIARKNDQIDFLSVVQTPGEDYGYSVFSNSIDALVIGRKTYDVARGFDPWPYTGKRCIVLTHSANSLGRTAPTNGEEFYEGDLKSLVARLGEEGVRRIYVDGGGVIRQFLDAGLIDDMTISILPIMIGEGIRLFDDSTRGDVALKIVTSRTFDSGLVQIVYDVTATKR